mgnify:CR=1 FL=1
MNYEFRIFQAQHNITVSLALDCEKMTAYAKEERHIKEENIRLQRKLQREMERREALSRQLSESESSLEMDDERLAKNKLKIKALVGTAVIKGRCCESKNLRYLSEDLRLAFTCNAPNFSLITERRPTIAEDTGSVSTIFLSVVAFKERINHKKPL